MQQNKWNELVGKKYVDLADSGDLVMEVYAVDPDFEDVILVRPVNPDYRRAWQRSGTLIASLVIAHEERKQKILEVLGKHPYLAIWVIADLVGVDLLEFGGVGLGDTAWTAAIDSLVEEGKIEELKDLSYRYRLVRKG
jgi:hypothetical protein